MQTKITKTVTLQSLGENTN